MKQFFISVVGKLWVTIILLSTIGLTIIVLLLIQIFIQSNLKDNKQLLQQTTTQIVQMVDKHYDNKAIQTQALDMLPKNMNALIVFPDEKELFHSANEHALSTKMLEKLREEIKGNSNKTNFQKIELQDEQRGEKISLYVSSASFESPNGKSKGDIYVFKSNQDIYKSVVTMSQTVAVFYFLSIIAVTVFALFLSTRIAAPIRAMRNAASQIASGDFDIKVQIVSNDEIADLGRSFNRMGRDLKANIQTIEAEKDQLSGLLGAMADGVIRFSREGKMMLKNPPADIFLSKWQASTDNLDKSAIPPVLADAIQEALASQSTQEVEIDIDNYSYAAVLTLIRDESGELNVIVITRDYTELKRMIKMRIDFISNVSHELKTPLSMMTGYSEAIIDGVAESKEEIIEFSTIINEEANRLARLVNDLLDVTRMESGFVDLNLNFQELRPLVEKVLYNYENFAMEHKVEMISEFETTDFVYNFDADRMHQVFVNLISNALRYASDLEHGGQVTIKQYVTDYFVVLDIIDNGPGITAEDLPYVFDRFYKADKARKRHKTVGTGIGLAIVKSIIEAHNGRISVLSNYGEGTTFRIELPLLAKSTLTIDKGEK